MSDSEYECEIEEQIADTAYAEEIAEYTREWERSAKEEELRWNLNEVWGKSLPDGMSLLAWEQSKEKFTDVFDTHTLFRELGVRGFGRLRVTQQDWRQLMESAHQYADMYNLGVEPVMCAMARWYIKGT